MNGLNDVTIPTPLHGDMLVYDSGTQQWVNAAGGMQPPHLVIDTYQAVAGDYILTDGDQVGGGFTITLPEDPPLGTRVMIVESNASGAADNATVIPFAGEKIRGIVDDAIILDIDWLVSEFIYLGNNNWTYRLDL